MATFYQVNASLEPKPGETTILVSTTRPPAKLIVDPTGQEPNSFKTLTDAARAAAKDATIELRFNGSRDIEHFRFSESKTTIKSGDGFHPKIVFRPTTSAGLTNTYCMASLTNSDIVFDNIEIEMVIPQSIDVIGDRWALFDLIGGSKIELRNVVLTFNNAQRDRAYQEKNAFFRSCPTTMTTPIPSSSSSGTSSSASLRTNLNLVLQNSLIRGEASLLRCDSSRAVKVDSDNVLIAINQPVFSLLDIKPLPSGPTSLITANFNHNTILAPTIVSWQQGSFGSTLGHPIGLTLNDSIVQFNRESAAMAVYSGGITQPDVTGFYDRTSSNTFYRNFANEWVIRSLQSGSSPREAPPKEKPSEQQRYFNTVTWKNSFFDTIPVHNLTKDHFLLDVNSSGQNILISTPDGTFPGIDPQRIPEIYNP